jgi:2,3-dihydroxyethylbenzene 1,2-dioxygenase
MNGVTELGYLCLGVRDLGAWKAFAGEVLGLELVAGETARRCYVRMDYWHRRILLEENGGDDLDAAGWRVAGPAELEEMAERLRLAEIPFKVASEQEAADRQVLGFIKATDPGGTPLEIFYGPRIEPGVPFHPTRRMHGPLVTGERGLGHIVIEQKDTKKSEAFYTRLMGMRGSIEYDRQRPGMPPLTLAFMSCNSRQHSLAFGNLNRGRRMSHVMMEFARLEDVGLTRDVVKAHQVEIMMDIGQHHNDRAVSFYVKTPSGWNWEIGWGVCPPSGQAEFGKGEIWGHDVPALARAPADAGKKSA